MCYGDMDYGKDGYYRRMVEQQLQQEFEARCDKVEHLRLTDDF